MSLHIKHLKSTLRTKKYLILIWLFASTLSSLQEIKQLVLLIRPLILQVLLNTLNIIIYLRGMVIHNGLATGCSAYTSFPSILFKSIQKIILCNHFFGI